MYHATICLGGLCWLVMAQPTPAARTPLGDYLDGLIVVRAEVVNVRVKNEASMEADVKIIHVYHGPARLVGAVFVDYYQVNHSVGSFADSPFRKGQKGIWSLVE